MDQNLRRIKYFPLWIFTMLCTLSTLVKAQEKNLIQIKAFDQQLNPIPGLKIIINDNGAVTTDQRGVAYLELHETDLPPKTIKVEREGFEAESWNYSKGVLEIIIRAKNFNTVAFRVVTADKRPLKNIAVTFYGNEVVTATTNENGIVEFPVPARQKISSRQFTIKAYHIVELWLHETQKTIVAEAIRANATKREEPKFFENYDIRNIDSIQSITAFYAIFKNYPIASLDDDTKKRIDAKFNQLIKQLGDHDNFIGKISDSSLVDSDIESLRQQAQAENVNLDEWRKQFQDKIKIVNQKLADGVGNLNEDSRQKLLSELNALEDILEQNEKKFYKNLTDYRSILGSLREKLVDVKSLNEKLYLSESQRQAEKLQFQKRLSTIIILTGAFSLLAIVFIYFSVRLKRKQQELIKANGDVKNLNDSLEGIVKERTKLLQQANDEMALFLYRTSHDLKGPVASILGLCNISLHVADSHSKELFEKTTHAALKMDRVLKKLSLIIDINQPGAISHLNVKVKIEQALSMHETFIKENGIAIETDLADELDLHSYPRLVEIVIANILENALFYSGLKKEQPLIKISCKQTNGSIAMCIHDNGIGIDAASINSIWNMFYIGDEHSKGNGLGLYVTYKAVHTLRGSIDVKSEKDQYTEFNITFPQL